MNNLEWLKRLNKCELANSLKFYENDMLCEIAYKIKYQDKCIIGVRDCSKCELNTFKNSLDFLLQEHKEPIKLKQWEYDLLTLLDKESVFHTVYNLRTLREKGHYKGVTDTQMDMEEILNNCIIVSDDYEGFEDCK